MSDERAKKIKLIIFDVDGVMTDGTIFLFPSPAGASGATTQEHREKMADKVGFGISSATTIEAKGFNAHDGTGFSLARLGGLKAAIITKRISETVALARSRLANRTRLPGPAGQGRCIPRDTRERESACRKKSPTSATTSSICR